MTGAGQIPENRETWIRIIRYLTSYVAILGAYAVVTKTGLLLAVLLVVSAWEPIEIAGISVCIIHAVLMAAAVYSLRKYWYAGVLWAAVIAAVILFLGNRLLVSLMLLLNGLFAVFFLCSAEACVFYQWESKKRHIIRQRKTAFLWRYFFRYLGCHRNYLLNTAVMWCAVLVMPYFLKELTGRSVAPVGFAGCRNRSFICRR